MAKLFKLCQILTLAFCLVAIGAMAPMEEPNAVWGDSDPDRVIEVFRTGKCESYSGGWGDFFKKVITGKWKDINFKYCPCIPLDLGELTDLSQLLSNLWGFITSIPSGFWSGEWDLGIATKKPQLENTQKKVWAKEWIEDAGARELVIQAEAMIKSIEVARSAAVAGMYNAILSTHQKYGVHSTDFRKKPLPKDILSYLQVTYTGITPMDKEEDRINAYLRRDSAANIMAAGKGSEHYDDVLSALDALYNELIKDDGAKDPFGNINELFNKITKVIESVKNVMDIKSKGWGAITEIPKIFSNVTDVMNSLTDLLKLDSLGLDKRMMLYQLIDSLLDDVVKNAWVWVYAVLDKNPAYPLGLIKDSFMPVMKDMLMLLFMIPPEKGQTKMLQLVMAMADQQAALTELNEYAILSFHDRKMVMDQAKNSKKAAIQSNITTIGHEAAVTKDSGKSHKIGF